MITIVEQAFWKKALPTIIFSMILFMLVQMAISHLLMGENYSFVDLLIQGALYGLIFGHLFTRIIHTIGKKFVKQISLNLDENEKIEVEGPANLFKGIEGVGGKLFITNKKIVFKSHNFNFQNGQTNIPFEEIIDVSVKKTAKLFNNGIRIKTVSGDKFDLVVDERKTWLNELRAKLKFHK